MSQKITLQNLVPVALFFLSFPQIAFATSVDFFLVLFFCVIVVFVGIAFLFWLVLKKRSSFHFSERAMGYFVVFLIFGVILYFLMVSGIGGLIFYS